MLLFLGGSLKNDPREPLLPLMYLSFVLSSFMSYNFGKRENMDEAKTPQSYFFS